MAARPPELKTGFLAAWGTKPHPSPVVHFLEFVMELESESMNNPWIDCTDIYGLFTND